VQITRCRSWRYYNRRYWRYDLHLRCRGWGHYYLGGYDGCDRNHCCDYGDEIRPPCGHVDDAREIS
jgi:hypothetical protein